MGKTFLLLIVFFVLAIPGCSRTIAFKNAGIQIYIPGNWNNSVENGVVTTESPGGGAAIVFTILKNSQIDDAMAEAEASIFESVGNLSLEGSVMEFSLYGMPVTMQKASAMNKQTAVSLTMILTPNGKCLMVMYVGNKAQEKIWRQDLSKILTEIRPLKQ